MHAFYNLKTGAKLAFVFGLCILLAVAVGATSLIRMAQMNSDAKLIVSDSLAGETAIGGLYNDIRCYRMLELRHVVWPISKRPEIEQEITSEQALVSADLAAYDQSTFLPDDKANSKKLQALWQTFSSENGKFIDLEDRGDHAGAVSYLTGPNLTDFNAVIDQLKVIADWNAKRGAGLADAATAAYGQSRIIVISLLSIALIFGLVMVTVLTRYITQFLSALGSRFERMNSYGLLNLTNAIIALEQGDLTQVIHADTPPLNIKTTDEFGKLGASYDETLRKLHQIVESFHKSQQSLTVLIRSLQSSAESVSSASNALSTTASHLGESSEEISASMSEVAQGSEQSARGASEVAQGSTSQARVLSQGSALVNQLVEAVHSVARDAESANTATDRANATALAGSQAVAQTVTGMKRIQTTVNQSAQVIRSLGETSGQIGAIVGTIEEIAEQTNLLALNAAIEAARAGEAGRGFAVVADEVRKLAERSRGATQEIGDLIGKVQKQTQDAVQSMEAGTKEVETGTALAEQAGISLSQIQEVVSAAAGQVTNICAAAEEMLASSEEVAATITEAAAIVEESSAAAEEMSASAEQVSSSIQNVASSVAQQGTAIEELASASASLSQIANDLLNATAEFTIDQGVEAGQSKSLRTDAAHGFARKAA